MNDRLRQWYGNAVGDALPALLARIEADGKEPVVVFSVGAMQVRGEETDAEGRPIRIVTFDTWIVTPSPWEQAAAVLATTTRAAEEQRDADLAGRDLRR